MQRRQTISLSTRVFSGKPGNMLGALKGRYLACAITQHIFKTVNTCSHVEKFRAAQAWKTHLAGGLPPFLSSWVTVLGARCFSESQTQVSGEIIKEWGQEFRHMLFLSRALPPPLSASIRSHKPCLHLSPTPPSCIWECAHTEMPSGFG